MLKKAPLDSKTAKAIMDAGKSVRVSPVEALIVNAFTPPDFLLRCVPDALTSDDSLRYLLGRMWTGKVIDYRRLVAAQERFGELPEEVFRVYRFSPCGIAKLAALKVRDRIPKYLSLM